jgi:hypothetical protein
VLFKNIRFKFNGLAAKTYAKVLKESELLSIDLPPFYGL